MMDPKEFLENCELPEIKEVQEYPRVRSLLRQGNNAKSLSSLRKSLEVKAFVPEQEIDK